MRQISILKLANLPCNFYNIFLAQDDRNQTPYDIACLYGNHECARLLRALHWAREKDIHAKRKLQSERENQKQKVLCKTIQNQLRKQEAENAYDEWLCRNNFSSTPPPPPPPRSTSRLSCETCSSISQLDSITQLDSLSTAVQSIHSSNEPKIAKIQISFNQAEHNTAPVGKPHKLYPYSNYPPKQYRCHTKTEGYVGSRNQRPFSSASNRHPSKRVVSHVRIKSAPTRIATGTERMQSKSKSKMPHTRKSIHKATINSVNETYNDIHGQTETMPSLIDTGKKEDNVAVLTEEMPKETTKDDANDEDGSSTSLDGLTFHDVGPENDLQSLASPVSNPSGRGATPSINPIEFLRVLSELSSQRTRSRSHGKYKPSTSIKYDRRFSLGSIPEGEMVTSYNKVEGSQVFDDDFLYNLMPFAFDSSHFQGTEEPPSDESPPHTPIERSIPSVKLAWGDSTPQTPDKSRVVSPANCIRKLSSKPLKKPLESSNRTPLKTSVCEFGGKISYTQNYK